MAVKTNPRGLPGGGSEGRVLKIIGGEPSWVVPADVFPKVLTYNDLPDPTLDPGAIYYIINSSGIWLVNRKPRGFYRSTGIAWEYAGEMVEAFDEANFEVYGGSRSVKLSLAAASNPTVLSIPAYDVTVGVESQYAVSRAVPASTQTAPLDWVYMNGAAAEVATAATSNYVMGVILTKPSTGSADILTAGISPAIFDGLIAGTRYFLAPGGGLTATPPSQTNHAVIICGVALNSTQLIISPQTVVVKS